MLGAGGEGVGTWVGVTWWVGVAGYVGVAGGVLGVVTCRIESSNVYGACPEPCGTLVTIHCDF